MFYLRSRLTKSSFDVYVYLLIAIINHVEGCVVINFVVVNLRRDPFVTVKFVVDNCVVVNLNRRQLCHRQLSSLSWWLGIDSGTRRS
jgi:hypothetical protein